MLHSVWDFLVRRIPRKDSLIKRKVGNHIMYLDVKDPGISAALMKMRPGSPEREAAFMKTLRQEVEEGMTVIDLGANIGYVTLIVAELVGPSGRVYAIEPHPRNCSILVKNIEANGYAGLVFPYQIGISNVSGVSTFYISDASNLHSMSATRYAKSSIDIEVSTLEEFMKDKGYPNFIKMDMEGGEAIVLPSMKNYLRINKPVLYLSMHPFFYKNPREDVKKIIDILTIYKNIYTEKGKKIELIGKSGEIKLCLPKIRRNEIINIVPISNGCNSNCSYCCVKIAKGDLFSYPKDKIIKEISDVIKNGCKESRGSHG